MVFEDENRPVHYKVHQDTRIRVLDPYPSQLVEVA
jgi:hypothetical protein